MIFRGSEEDFLLKFYRVSRCLEALFLSRPVPRLHIIANVCQPEYHITPPEHGTILGTKRPIDDLVSTAPLLAWLSESYHLSVLGPLVSQ